MRFCSKTNRPAFTVIELIVLVGVILLLALVLIPSMGKAHRKADLINCANNLKQVGLGFRLWEGDGEHFPMLVRTNRGGTLEVSNDVWRTFLVMSNELKTPKLLLCPADTRAAVTSWASLANTNISYFVCLEADETLPDMPLSGDRNLTNNRPLANHVLTVTPTAASLGRELCMTVAGISGFLTAVCSRFPWSKQRTRWRRA